MSKYPKITVVTACYNMARYIERTISSVVEQGYPNLEYIVVDGASTDNTAQIVRQYEDKLASFISEPDQGQYHAIQKGFDRATGDIMAWLNADDVYLPWTFSIVSEIFEKFPDIDWIVGSQSFINEMGQCVGVAGTAPAYPREYISNGWFRSHLGGYLQQESMFWRRKLWEKIGGLDLNLNVAADFKLWTEFAKHTAPVSLLTPLAAFRYRPGSQRSSAELNVYEKEVAQVCKNLQKPPFLWDFISSKSIILRCLCRLMMWKKCRIIAYSRSRQKWVLRTMRVPISRTSFQNLIIENTVK